MIILPVQDHMFPLSEFSYRTALDNAETYCDIHIFRSRSLLNSPTIPTGFYRRNRSCGQNTCTAFLTFFIRLRSYSVSRDLNIVCRFSELLWMIILRFELKTDNLVLDVNYCNQLSNLRTIWTMALLIILSRLPKNKKKGLLITCASIYMENNQNFL